MASPTSYLMGRGISSLPTTIPTPVRLYVRQFMPRASEETLTEEYFPKEELEAMLTLIGQSRIRGEQKEVPGRPRIESTLDNLYWADPANMGFRVPWKKRSYERLPGFPKHGSVQYVDYSSLLPHRGATYREAALSRRKEGDPTVPISRVLGSLGAFPWKIVKDPKTGGYKYLIGGEAGEEKYSWNPDYGERGIATGKQYATLKNMLNRIIGRKQSKRSAEQQALGVSTHRGSRYPEMIDTHLWGDLLRMLGSRFGPRETEGEGIPFRISIPAPRKESE